jgi:outer membrane protein assembly factor BamB
MTHAQTRIIGSIPPKRPNPAMASVLALAPLLCGTSLGGNPVESDGENKTSQSAPAVPSPDDDWPCWRGPGGGGVRGRALAVTQWSESRGILWKAAVPGQGHASPILFGDQVFVSTADEPAQTQALIAYHRRTGALLWNTPFYHGRFPYKHARNSHASATPACDGRHVFVPSVADNALWLTAISLSGKVAWQSRLGPFASEWGYASSPALYKNLVIVVGDNKGSPGAVDAPDTSYLLGVDRTTGRTVWRVPRPLTASYGTPVVARLAGRDQVLIGGAERIVAYDPGGGQEIWSFRWGAARSANSMVCGPDVVYASTTARENQILCIRADGTGDVTDTHLVWKQARGAADVPSPLYHDGRLYLTTDQGMAVCLDGATGKTLWQNRLGGPVSASPVLAGQAILSIGEDGKAHLFKAGRPFEVLANNSLNDRVLASPALAGDHLFLRGRTYLYCLDGRTQGLPVTVNAQPIPKPSRPVERRPESTARPANVPAPAEKDDDLPWWFWLGVAILAVLTMMAWIAVAVRLVAERRIRNQLPPAGATGAKTPSGAPPALVYFPCSGCPKSLKVNRRLAGKKVKCPHCGNAVLVPAALADAINRKS